MELYQKVITIIIHVLCDFEVTWKFPRDLLVFGDDLFTFAAIYRNDGFNEVSLTISMQLNIAESVF